MNAGEGTADELPFREKRRNGTRPPGHSRCYHKMVCHTNDATSHAARYNRHMCRAAGVSLHVTPSLV